MRIENNNNWIEIEFICYVIESVCHVADIFDESNSVEIDFNFDVEDVGWGCVGDEYFHTKDIKALSEGFLKILYNETSEFVYSGDYTYKQLSNNPFYIFSLKRINEEINFELKIHDRLDDYITVLEVMSVARFKEIVDEFLVASKKFPVV